MLLKLLAVALGGALGAMARFGISNFCAIHFGKAFPWGTFAVNIIGCFVIGFFAMLFLEKNALTPAVRLFLTVGFLGGLTTFSTFSLETVELFRNGNLVNGLLNVGGNVVVGLAGTLLGMLLAKALWICCTFYFLRS